MSDVFVNIRDENVWVRNPGWLPIPAIYLEKDKRFIINI